MTRRTHGPITLVSVAGLAVLAVGCTTVAPKPAPPDYQGKAEYARLAAPPGSHPYTLVAGESASGTTLARNPDPIYPATLVPLALPSVTVTARLSVNDEGGVTAVWISQYQGAKGYRQAFANAARHAAMRWVFVPLTFTRTTILPGGKHVTRTTAKPFSLWFQFYFNVVNGKPMTSSSGK